MGLLELIAYGFLFLAFLLFNWVSQRAKQRRLERQRIALEKFRQQPGGLDAGDFGRSEAPRRAEPRVPRPVPPGLPETTGQPADPLGQDWGREPPTVSYETLSYEIPSHFRDERPAVPQLRVAPPSRPAQAPRPPRKPRRPILRTQRDLRDAVVAMTVLDPCRALQPYDAAGTDRPLPGAGAGPRTRPVA